MIEQFIGRWKVIGCQLNTKWLRRSIFKEFIYIITADDTFEIEWSNLTWPDYLGGFPKSSTGKLITTEEYMDFIPDDGPFKGKTLPGIIHADHDIIKINVAFPGNDRPSAFTSKQGEVYEIWQRII